MMLGLDNSIHHTYRNFGGVAWAPSALASIMRLWVNADLTTGTDGVKLTSVPDQSGQGNTLTEGAAGAGPTYRATRWGGKPCIDFANGWLISRAANLLNVVKGTNQQFEVVIVGQWYNSATSYQWSFGADVATTEYLTARNNGTGVFAAQLTSRFSATAATVKAPAATSPIALQNEEPQVLSWRRDGSQVLTCEINGIVDSTNTLSDTGFDIENFTLGAWKPGGTPTVSSSWFCRHVFVFARPLTSSERAALYAWIKADSPGFDHCAGLGATAGGSGNTLVIAVLGQSNGEGRDPSLQQPTSGRLYKLGHDMFFAPYSEPSGDPTNNIYSFSHTGAGQSCFGALVDALRAQGVTDDIIIVNCCVGGTGSNTINGWANSVSTSPPLANSLLGVAKYRILSALRNVPNPRFACVIWQGESDSDTLAHAQAWNTNWDVIRTELETWIPARKDWAGNPVQWWKNTHYWVIKLPPTAWTLGPNWQDVRTAQDNFKNAHADVAIVQAANGPWLATDNLHLVTAAQISTGTAVGNSMALAA